MLISYFTERPYRGLSEAEILQNGSYFGLSNSRFDPALGAQLYNEYLSEYCFAEELGFDAVSINEHHGNPWCMSASANLFAAVLARVTERVKLMIIGNPLPVHGNPLRVAEELAEIDLISQGRLIAGWVRGAGPEQFFNNRNPAINRELFEEAHDFIIDAWTKPGPWRYEGKHFHYRHVNPWALPLQQPHPPTMIPGVLSTETMYWAADRDYPYLGLGTSLGPTSQLWELYADRVAERGVQAGPENFGYLTHVAVADTEDEATELARSFLFARGAKIFARPEHTLPPGFLSESAAERLANQTTGAWLGLNRDKLLAGAAEMKELTDADFRQAQADINADLQKMRDNYQIIAGTPDQVMERIETILRVVRPGSFVFMNAQGNVGSEARRKSMSLLAEHVLPGMREISNELRLTSQFEAMPGQRKLDPGQTRQAVTNPDALPASLTG